MAKTDKTPRIKGRLRRELLTCDTMGDLGDGYVRKIVDKELAELLADIRERGEDDKKERTLTITLSFKPHSDGLVTINAKTAKKLPNRQPPPTQAKYDMVDGALVFNPEVADNPDQMNFGEGGDDGK